MEFALIAVAVAGLALVLVSSRAATAERRHQQLSARLTDLDRKVDAIITHLGVTIPEPDHSDLLRLLRENKKIHAVKLYREQSGAGLKEALDHVESLARRHGL